jgi:hypothetical protein
MQLEVRGCPSWLLASLSPPLRPIVGNSIQSTAARSWENVEKESNAISPCSTVDHHQTPHQYTSQLVGHHDNPGVALSVGIADQQILEISRSEKEITRRKSNETKYR